MRLNSKKRRFWHFNWKFVPFLKSSLTRNSILGWKLNFLFSIHPKVAGAFGPWTSIYSPSTSSSSSSIRLVFQLMLVFYWLVISNRSFDWSTASSNELRLGNCCKSHWKNYIWLPLYSVDCNEIEKNERSKLFSCNIKYE